MKYNVVFTSGYIDDSESLIKDYKSDVIIQDEIGDYYEINFMTIDRIKIEFNNQRNCYLESNLVILREITKDSILNSIPDLHKWMFQKRWLPLRQSQLEKYYYPKEDWVISTVKI